jgi:predicted nucleic acid-binding protein
MIGDSSFFVARADSKDRWHKRALRLDVPAGLVITDLIAAESITIVGERGGGKAAQTLYEYFVDECEVVFLDEEMLNETMALHLRYDGTLSVADCASVAVMSREAIQEIVSFDSDFDKVRGIRRVH